MTTYHPALTRLAHITRKYLSMLHMSENLKKAIPNSPLIAFSRPRNLRDLFVRTSLHTPTPPTDAGNYACNTPRCKTCHISTTTVFKSNTTSRGHKIRACKTSNLVYLISCKKCSIQYVGEMENPLHIQMNGHCSDIRTEKPVTVHFTLPDHSVDDLEVMGIEKIREGDTTQWRKLNSQHLMDQTWKIDITHHQHSAIHYLHHSPSTFLIPAIHCLCLYVSMYLVCILSEESPGDRICYICSLLECSVFIRRPLDGFTTLAFSIVHGSYGLRFGRMVVWTLD